MNKKFSLIEELNTKPNKDSKKDPFPPGIEYQEYILEVNGVDQEIFIPLRECERFENALGQKTTIDDDDLRNILRTHRGIRKS